MHRNEVNPRIKDVAFDFFYWFSRFEFSLKENGLLASHNVGTWAEPGWSEFIQQWHRVYVESDAARELARLAPRRQVVGSGGGLTWAHVDLKKCDSKLSETVLLLKTIRNNLFHGGKHGLDDWDDDERAAQLLRCGRALLDELASLSGAIEADYKGSY